MLEDKHLIWKLKRGDEDALRQIYEKYKALLSYAAPINELLNAVNPLRGDSRTISEGLEREIKGYIAYKMDLE